MKISNILKINVIYLKNNFWEVIKMCRIIILTLLLVMLTQRIVSEFQRKIMSKTTDDYMIIFHDETFKLDDLTVLELNSLIDDKGTIKNMGDEPSELFKTINSQDIELNSLNLCNDYSHQFIIINKEVSGNYALNINDRLMKKGLVYQIIAIQDILPQDKEVLVCKEVEMRDKNNTFILKLNNNLHVKQDLKIIKNIMSKKTLLAEQDIYLEKIGSKEILSEITSLAKRVIDLLTVLIVFFSFCSIISILELIALKRKEEFEILKYNGLFLREEIALSFMMMIMLIVLSYLISKVVVFVLWDCLIGFIMQLIQNI